MHTAVVNRDPRMPEIAKTTRVVDAYDRMKEEIRTARMPPGFQAPEPEIALRLGMSRTPVREALIRLQSEGLVELIPRRGVRVLPIRPDDMREIYEVLSALEPEAAAGLASRNPSASELRPLEKAMAQMEKALVDGELDSWAEADDRFHLALLDLHGNRRLRGFVVALNDQVHRVRMVTLRLRETPHRSNEEHRTIVHHLRNGDPEAAAAAFRAHRQRAAAELVGILEKYRLGQL